jgi:endonuclease-8
VPEGDTLHRAAARLQPLVGQTLQVEAVHPRALAANVAPTLDGRRLESIAAVGKNLVLRFEGGVVLRSHLRMTGKWSLRPAGAEPRGQPWLILRGSELEGVLWGGPVLELHARALARLGPDILAGPPDLDAMLARLRRADPTRTFGETLLDQGLVAGIGNIWCSESLWEARLSPWAPLGEVPEADRRAALETAARLMRAAVDAPAPPRRQVYNRTGRPCPRCGTPIRSLGIGDANRTTYWCPGCQSARPSGEP